MAVAIRPNIPEIDDTNPETIVWLMDSAADEIVSARSLGGRWFDGPRLLRTPLIQLIKLFSASESAELISSAVKSRVSASTCQIVTAAINRIGIIRATNETKKVITAA